MARDSKEAQRVCGKFTPLSFLFPPAIQFFPPRDNLSLGYLFRDLLYKNEQIHIHSLSRLVTNGGVLFTPVGTPLSPIRDDQSLLSYL